MAQAGDQHPLQLGLILRRHHREVRDGTHVADVVLALVRRPIRTDDAGTVEHEGDRKLLNSHIVDQLVIGPLQEGAVDGNDRPKALAGHSGGQGHGVLLGDSDIDVLIGNGLLEADPDLFPSPSRR